MVAGMLLGLAASASWALANVVVQRAGRAVGALRALLAGASPPSYVAIMGYVQPSAEFDAAVSELRVAIRNATKATTTFGYGPRFLHSTGQDYKGGPNTGVFLQITADDVKDLKVPGQKASFGVIKAAQARGDFDVMTERGRRALRVHLKGGLKAGLKNLDAAISEALS